MLIVSGKITLSCIETTLYRHLGNSVLGLKIQVSVMCVQPSKVHRFTKDTEGGATWAEVNPPNCP